MRRVKRPVRIGARPQTPNPMAEEGAPRDVLGNPRAERLRQFLASHL